VYGTWKTLERNAYVVFFRNPEGKRPSGKPRPTAMIRLKGMLKKTG
jgi:hypothetical protein